MNEGIKVMKKDTTVQSTLFKNLEETPLTYGSIIFNKEKFIQVLEEINNRSDLGSLKHKVFGVSEIIKSPKSDRVRREIGF